MYCVFESEDVLNFLLSQDSTFNKTDIFKISPSDKGDKCHIDIKGIDNKLSRKLSKHLLTKDKLKLCDSDFDFQSSDDEEIANFLCEARNAMNQ